MFLRTAKPWVRVSIRLTRPQNVLVRETAHNFFSTSPTTSYSARSSPKGALIPNTSIKLFRDPPSIRQWRLTQLHAHRTIGFVPTMGALHTGHLSLIRLAASENSHVVVSIYVNPTQFGVSEDLSSYPQTWDRDISLLRDLDRELAADGGNLGRISAVFAPNTSVVYPSGPPSQEIDAQGTFVTLTPLSTLLEGRTRPTFFRGVATICTKLFNIVRPERVYFGQKDVQQTVVIKKLVKDLCMDVSVIVGPTMREEDGLALSSRNVYLGSRRRAVAPVLSQALSVAEKNYTHGDLSRSGILEPAHTLMETVLRSQFSLPPSERVNFELDYLSLADPETMEEIETVDPKKGAIVSGAIKMLPVEEPQEGEDLGVAGGPAVRLIDNVILKPVETEVYDM